jgi:hypothetical protein
MRPHRRLAAVSLGCLGLVWVAVPAWAHDQSSVHSVSFNDDNSNTERDSPDDGDRILGTDYVVGHARMDDGVDQWRIEMRPEVGGEVTFCDKTAPAGSDFGTDYYFRCNWDTTRLGNMSDLAPKGTLGTGPASPNGRYVITITAWNKGRSQGVLSSAIPREAHVVSTTRTVIVQNPVSAPTGVSRSYDSNTGRVTVTWAPNPEPDVQKYVIQEKRGSGGWENVGERPHGANSFEKALSDVGTYQYRVAAVRPEVAQSSFSEGSPLEVAASPPPPSATPDGSAQPPGPEPGVTVLETPTTATTTQPGAIAAPGGSRPPAGGGGSGLFARPSVNSLPRPSAPKTTPTTIDTGYSAELPYDTAPKTQKGVLADDEELAGAEQPQSMTKLINVPRPRDPRSLLVPMAGGLTIFVFAMQMTYVVRRRPALVQIDDDFGDWMGL